VKGALNDINEEYSLPLFSPFLTCHKVGRDASRSGAPMPAKGGNDLMVLVMMNE
jgi:hypothetical protein